MSKSEIDIKSKTKYHTTLYTPLVIHGLSTNISVTKKMKSIKYKLIKIVPL